MDLFHERTKLCAYFAVKLLTVELLVYVVLLKRDARRILKMKRTDFNQSRGRWPSTGSRAVCLQPYELAKIKLEKAAVKSLSVLPNIGSHPRMETI